MTETAENRAGDARPQARKEFLAEAREIVGKRKVALASDWLTNVGGAEKVLLELHRLFPEAPIYTSKYDPKGIDWFLDADVRTGYLQRFPAGMRRVLGVFRERWFSRLDLSEYDLVISVTGAEAKGVRKIAPDGVHISYCHVPTQYYWQMYDEYMKDPGFGVLNPIVRVFFKMFVSRQRKKDFLAAQEVGKFVTISEYARELIAKYYKREAVVVAPGVEVLEFREAANHGDLGEKESRKAKSRADGTKAGLQKTGSASVKSVEKSVENFYVTSSRQVNWKRLDLAILACLKVGRKLVVIGEGPEHERLRKLASSSDLIKFVPLLPREELAKYLARARGYIFPSMEPFGMAPVEALAVGCPVIAFNEGGARDYVVDGENGVLFPRQTVPALSEAILRFEKTEFSREKVMKSAEKFSREEFDRKILGVIREATHAQEN